MRRAGGYTILFTLIWACAVAAQVRELVDTSFQARIVSVVDGDTVDAVLTGEQRPIRIRLEGIDTPERGEPFSDAAQRFTRVLLFDQIATFDGQEIDRYGRLVARIGVGGKDSSFELVRAGLACHYTAYSDDPALARAQLQAKQEGLGFWAAGVRTPRCVQASRVTANARPASPAQARVFHGNISSRVYHAPTCRNFNCRNCTRAFQSEEQARAAGFRPAGDCLRR